MAGGMTNALFWRMMILLISWAGLSAVFCLALLSAAARPLPRMDGQMASRSETALAHEFATGLEHVNAASASARAALPSPCHAA